ncbi:hypothetical protein [Microbacterium sp. E-13]|uniref:hypothetical protein n=1 Tax=Microbacterium sp. E-13 TaxID=3404048 RepID=UPI003CEF72EF
MSTFVSSSRLTGSVRAQMAVQNPGRADPIGSVLIDRRFNGPRRFANGGFAAGSIAQHVDAETVTVVLQRPIPLARELAVVQGENGGALVYDRQRLLARAHPGRLTDAPAPVAPTYEDALDARSHHPLVGVRHPLSDCVVCGPRRPDGMRVTPGPLRGHPGRLAAPWSVDARVARAGLADYRAVWAAVDCTSYPRRALDEGVLCLLGTMTARIERRPRVGEHLVVHSWTREEHGRRFETSVAMIDEAGGVVARADATWVALKPGRAALLGGLLR